MYSYIIWFSFHFFKNFILIKTYSVYSFVTSSLSIIFLSFFSVSVQFIFIVRILVFYYTVTSLVAQTVKHLTTMWETQVQSLGWEDLLEEEMATHSSILAWKIPWTEEPGRLQSMGSQRAGHD